MEDQSIIKGELDICRVVCKFTATHDFLFGRTETEQLSHVQFINNCKKNESNLMEYLNEYLSSRTFCNGYSITISDFYAFAHVLVSLKDLHDQEKWKNR